MSQPYLSAAVDLGATSGRVIVGIWENDVLKLDEVHRFSNAIQSLGSHDYWNIGGLHEQILSGLQAARKKYPALASCGINTWGVDHVLLDRDGRLIFPAHAYRDERTSAACRELQSGAEERIYALTGIATYPFNTSLQLTELFGRYPALREMTGKILYLPNFFAYLLCGQMATDYSIASTSQLLSLGEPEYDPEVLAHFGIPDGLLPTPEPAGRILGTIEGVSGLEGLEVVLTPGHDTAAAFAAVPQPKGERTLLLSSGTWSLVGFQHDQPITGPEALAAGISNERMGTGRFRPVRNILGLWLLEQTLPDLGGTPQNAAEWEALIAGAEASPPIPAECLIQIDDPRLFNPENMKKAIGQQLAERKQPIPSDRDGFVRLIIASLAEGQVQAVRFFAQLTGEKFSSIAMVGGGSRNRLLCQETANRSGLPVFSYALEGTAVGNIGHQLVAVGAIASLEDFQNALGQHLVPTIYQPALAS